ncbi:MAG: hypothetical protein D6715_11635 [Calditrichaeota bacterium]|nr:MAG: hypothetical protein D6715_11635 [Calditrichota bacterium]
MHLNRDNAPGSSCSTLWEVPRSRYFWWPFGKKKKGAKVALRPGALPPEKVKQIVKSIGVGKTVEILRIGYDGTIDDIPLLVKITDINEEGFSGRIVNVERELIEQATEKLVFAKRGGGFIEFRYDDGDIKEITESKEETILEESRDVAALKEILEALEIGDRVLVAYYDEERQGTVNVEGTLLAKDPGGTQFTLLIEQVEKVELEKKIEREFDIEKDLVVDIEIV